ncbi:MAG TPA: hypothetical protein VGE08_15525 [Steroidobacter sp.]|uniref:hypothetical protein n=1 Tax=Steroidobacter sp. TaxID=1978227 RepID=UPI002ED9CA5D
MATKAKRSKTPAKKKSSKATSRVRWTSQNDREMKALIKQQTPARAIAKQLDRTEAAVRQRIHKLGLSLRSSKKKAARKAK